MNKNFEYCLILERNCDSSNKTTALCQRFNLDFETIYKTDLSKEELDIMTPLSHSGVAIIYQNGQYFLSAPFDEHNAPGQCLMDESSVSAHQQRILT